MHNNVHISERGIVKRQVGNVLPQNTEIPKPCFNYISNNNVNKSYVATTLAEIIKNHLI